MVGLGACERGHSGERGAGVPKTCTPVGAGSQAPGLQACSGPRLASTSLQHPTAVPRLFVVQDSEKTIFFRTKSDLCTIKTNPQGGHRSPTRHPRPPKPARQRPTAEAAPRNPQGKATSPTPPPTVNAPSPIYRQPNTSAGNGTPAPLLPPDLKARALRFYRATVIPIKLGNGKTFNLHTLPVVLVLLLL